MGYILALIAFCWVVAKIVKLVCRQPLGSPDPEVVAKYSIEQREGSHFRDNRTPEDYQAEIDALQEQIDALEAERDSLDYEPAPQKRKSGCLGKLILSVVALPVIFFAMIGGFDGTKYRSQTQSQPAKSTTRVTTARPTKTAKPTATPKPTDTPVPDFKAMQAEEAVQALALYYASPQISPDYVMEQNGVVNVQALITDKNWSAKTAVQNVCEYVLDIAEPAFKNQDVDSLVFYFNAELRDAYGNLNTSRVINVTIKRATAEKLNFDWMDTHIFSSTQDFFNVMDSYNVHQAFKEGLY